ncbi:MAG: acyl-[acyl-carrier-protein]--UDP-N-acetylglucosamine O-acyltransferase [Rhizobiaceae bacterium MnEN-MB40S]|nr:MAG: acyl-[acyl-carrier-protein]--UDP-N-acetylglucosamine O-acyltransferase [Rhizobiaceae bacterium MnEN-MB40S]
MISASARIHPSSIIEDGASIGDNVSVGPFCHIGSRVTLADNIEVMNHVSILGRTTIGAGTRIFPGAVLGAEPQNVHYKGEDTELIIGSGCTIREGVTMHTGMPDAGGKTTVGDNSLFLAYAHVAHDCHIGSNVILSNNVMLGGHVVVGDRVIMGGGAAAHQFCRIGHHAFVGGLAACSNDVIPYGMLNGNPGILGGLNVIGMTRSGISKSDIHAVRRVYKLLFSGDAPINEILKRIKPDYQGVEVLDDLFEFIEADSHRGLSSAAKNRRN